MLSSKKSVNFFSIISYPRVRSTSACYTQIITIYQMNFFHIQNENLQLKLSENT